MPPTSERRVVGTVNEAARLYRTDAAGVWAAISGRRPRTLWDGRRIRLYADRRDDEGFWIVEEEQLGNG